jgi:preprotein translocase subunit YajC
MTPPLPLALLQAAAPGGSNPMYSLIFQLGAIFAIFYFLVIRPQQKQRKQQEQMLLALKRDDEIVTTGGIVAHVVHIKEKVTDGKPAPTLDDLVTIKSGESKLIVERGKIAKVVPRAAEAVAKT